MRLTVEVLKFNEFLILKSKSTMPSVILRVGVLVKGLLYVTVTF